jgi:hypothetical protein
VIHSYRLAGSEVCPMLDKRTRLWQNSAMNTAQARRRLSDHGWLAAMPQEFRLALLDRCEWQPFKAGETIYLAGDSPGGIYGVCEGALAMTSGQGPGPALGHSSRASPDEGPCRP